jgi:peptidoglycan/LPS O-acetylase OafA/YrhL
MQRRHPVKPFQSLPAVFMIVATVALALRIATGSKYDYGSYLTPSHLRIDSLLFGVLLGYYKHFEPDTFTKIGRSKAALGVTLLSVVLLCFVRVEDPVMFTVGFTILYLGFGLLLARFIEYVPGQICRLAIAPLAMVGVYSYSIYLWHLGIARLMPPGLFAFTAYIALSIALGITMAKIVEMPVLALRDRWFPAASKSY